jgi:hypothetical protein
MALTAGQRRAQRELGQIASSIGMDHWNIDEYEDEARIPMLKVMKNRLIRGEIVMKYALIDEFLTVIICNYYFRKKARDQPFRALWKTKKFKIFNHEIMDQIFLLQKMRIVHTIEKIPKGVRESIERINAVRNDIAHSFFPENRKAHMPVKRRLYQGDDIFTLKGVEKFEADFAAARNYLARQAYGVSWDANA